jgi:protein pelota
LKVIKEDLKNNEVTVIPQSSEDLYILYNLLLPEDQIRAKTTRKIKNIGSGKDSTSRISVLMQLLVNEVEFTGFSDVIRVKGLIRSASDEHVSLGTHHSINITLLKELTIIKDNWTKFDLDNLRTAQLGSSSGLILIAIDDEGALVAQVGSHAMKILNELRPSMTRKGSDPNQYNQSKEQFFKILAKYLDDIKDITDYKVIGGPGFIHEEFMDFIKNNYRPITKNTINVGLNSAGRPGLRELIIHHIPQQFVNENSAKAQADLVEDVLDHLGKNTGLVSYASDAFLAAELGAVEHLLILDTELRTTIELRKKIDDLIKLVKNSRGKVTIMSSMHETGKIIEGFGRIVALLRFKLPK